MHPYKYFTPTLVSTSVHSDSVPSGWAGATVDDLRFRLQKKGTTQQPKEYIHVSEVDTWTCIVRYLKKGGLK